RWPTPTGRKQDPAVEVNPATSGPDGQQANLLLVARVAERQGARRPGATARPPQWPSAVCDSIELRSEQAREVGRRSGGQVLGTFRRKAKVGENPSCHRGVLDRREEWEPPATIGARQ